MNDALPAQGYSVVTGLLRLGRGIIVRLYRHNRGWIVRVIGDVEICFIVHEESVSPAVPEKSKSTSNPPKHIKNECYKSSNGAYGLCASKERPRAG